MINHQNELQSFHSGIINVIKFNPSGTRFATGGSDGKINIFSYIPSLHTYELQSEIFEHKLAVLDLSWGETTTIGTYLVSAGYDEKLLFFKEIEQKFILIHLFSVQNSIFHYCEFSPKEYGLYTLSLCSEGDKSTIYLISLQKDFSKTPLTKDNNFTKINSLSWGPSNFAIKCTHKDNNKKFRPLQFVSGGKDGLVLWELLSFDKAFTSVIMINGVVVDVEWLKCFGFVYDTIAASLINGEVCVFKEKEGQWTYNKVVKMENLIVKLNWSVGGSCLGVVTSKNDVYVYQENLDEVWEEIEEDCGNENKKGMMGFNKFSFS